MFRRLKQAWAALNSKVITPEKIYVYASEHNPNKFVQLMYYRDNVLALNAEGKIWKINEDYSGFVCQEFLFNSPTRYYNQ